jgi:hypothetical protein
MCRIKTLVKIPPWVKVSDREGKSATRIAFKECFDGSVNRNMKSTLGKRHKDETCIAIKYNTTRLLLCEVLQSQRRKDRWFFMFRESENH